MTFASDIRRFNSKTENRLVLAMKKLAFDMTNTIIKRTPVDTGMAKRNWHVEINNRAEFIRNDTDKTGARTVSEAREEINNIALGDVVYITNNLPYIVRLENGWSEQAPNGMVGRTVVEYRSILDAIVRSLK